MTLECSTLCSLVSNLSHRNPIHAHTPYFFKILNLLVSLHTFQMITSLQIFTIFKIIYCSSAPQNKWKCSTCCHCLYRRTVSAFQCHSSTVLAMYWGSLHPSYMAQQLSCLVPALRLRNRSKQCSSRGASFIILCSILQICVCWISDYICGCNPDF